MVDSLCALRGADSGELPPVHNQKSVRTTTAPAVPSSGASSPFALNRMARLADLYAKSAANPGKDIRSVRLSSVGLRTQVCA